MARDIQDYDGQVHAPDADYPSGDIKDETGALDGTVANRVSNADIHQLMMKMMREAGITANGLPDNEYNGLQLFEALLAVTRPYYTYSVELAQNSTNAPSETVIYDDVPGTLTWGYTSAGVYTLTYVGSITNIFSSGFCATLTPREGFATIEFTSSSVITIRTFDASGTPSNDLLGSNGFRADFKK
jgi:hypothetical protein